MFCFTGQFYDAWAKKFLWLTPQLLSAVAPKIYLKSIGKTC